MSWWRRFRRRFKNTFKQIGKTIAKTATTVRKGIVKVFTPPRPRPRPPIMLPPPNPKFTVSQQSYPVAQVPEYPATISYIDYKNKMASMISGINNYITNVKNTYISTQNDQVNLTFDKLSKLSVTDISNLVQQVKIQNDTISHQLYYNNQNSHETKYIKSEYQKIEIDKLQNQNKYLYFIFYIALSLLGLVMFYNNNLNKVLQLIILILLLLWPILIYYFELFLFIIYNYLVSFFSSTPLSNVYISNY